MKIKKFNYALLGLLAFSLTASAQQYEGDELEVGCYKYTVNADLGTKLNGTVTVVEVLDQDNFIKDNVLQFPGNIEYQVGSKKYTYKVTKMAPTLFHDIAYDAKSVTIPKELTEIPEGAFNTCTRLETITFEAGSQVKTIKNKAFASTMITSFDFTPCTLLEELDDNVFIDVDKPETNVNSFITSVTLPTGPEFKHINAAFRNLPELTEIVNLDKSYITELVAGSFDGDKKLTTVSLPNTIKWIDGNALEGSAVESFTVDVKSLISLGGGTVVLDEKATTMRDKYMFVPYGTKIKEEGDNKDPKTNLYNLGAKPAAPLKALVLKGELGGKICSYAFADCTGLTSTPAEGGQKFDLDQLTYGSKAQIEESAFAGCTGITALTINDIADNQLTAGEFTIEGGAFGDCPIATLTIGDVTTANAIGKGAFGKKLKDVTIGTVKAGTSVFEAGAFVWDDVDETTLKLATGQGEFVSADSPDKTKPIIGEGVFDFSAVGTKATKLPVVEIGEIKSQGGVFANGALNGPTISDLTFTGNINVNGIDNPILGSKKDKEWVIKYEMKAKTVNDLPQGAEKVTEPQYTLEEVGKYIQPEGVEGYAKIIGIKAANEQAVGGDIPAAQERAYIFEEEVALYERADGVEYDPTAEGDAATPREGMFQKEGEKYKKIVSAKKEETFVNKLKNLTFKGEILTNGIGYNDTEVEGTVIGGAFANLLSLKKVVFEKLLAENAVAAGSFEGSGLVGEDGNIGTEEDPFVDYQLASIEDYTVNPFNSNAFVAFDYVADLDGDESNPVIANPIERIIWWNVENDNLRKSIANAIHKDVLDNDGDVDTEYDGDDVDKKFNVYKWIDILAEEEEALANSFLVFRNQNEPNVAWGRYDLGSFKVEKGKYYKDDADEDGVDDKTGFEAYTATNMKIARRQKIDGSDVNITLYGLYTEQDDNKQLSSTYMVPLYAQDGYYYIRKQNKELIIVKVEKLNGDFTVEDLPVAYTNTQQDEDALTWKLDEEGNAINEIVADAKAEKELEIGQGTSVASLTPPTSSVWIQLFSAPDYTKADKSWTHEDLIDQVKKLMAETPKIKGYDLWIMTDPAKYNGFRIDKNAIEKGNGAFIGLNWYYSMLKNYDGDTTSEARVIWLDDAQATAIFSVNAFNGVTNDGAIYNLQGIRVNGTQKGVYIQNGKKFIVK